MSLCLSFLIYKIIIFYTSGKIHTFTSSFRLFIILKVITKPTIYLNVYEQNKLNLQGFVLLSLHQCSVKRILFFLCVGISLDGTKGLELLPKIFSFSSLSISHLGFPPQTLGRVILVHYCLLKKTKQKNTPKLQPHIFGKIRYTVQIGKTTRADSS